MWHYTEGIHNWDPIWPDHAIRIIPGPSSLWFDATGRRLPAPYFPGFDSLGTLRHIGTTGYDYTWFVLNQSIIEKEFALSGSEQNPDITGKDVHVHAQEPAGQGSARAGAGVRRARRGLRRGRQPRRPRRGMNKIARGPQLDDDDLERQIVARDNQVGNKFSKDLQLMAIGNARRHLTDKIMRVAKPHRILDPSTARSSRCA